PDATDDPLHGSQQGAYFHGYYRHYCYLPLYCFCGNIPLFAKLRDCKRDASDGTVEALQKIVPAIRQRFGKKVRIIVRADSGFAREAIMAWCEENHVFYCLGLARNDRLTELLKTDFEALRAQIKETKVETPCRSFTEFEYSTLDSWTKARRVIGKAEILSQGDNPRFIVTNLPKDGWATRAQAARFEAAVLYEKFYCARGDMENRIKEQQMDLFADRTSTHWLASNQLRLWFSAFAHLIMSTLQAGVLKGTELEAASIGQIRLRLFKISARFTSDSVPWAAPLNIRTQPTELKSCLARAGQKCKSFVSEDRRDRLHRRKIAVIRNKAPQSQVISLCRESKVKRRHNITYYVYVMLLFCDFCGLDAAEFASRKSTNCSGNVEAVDGFCGSLCSHPPPIARLKRGSSITGKRPTCCATTTSWRPKNFCKPTSIVGKLKSTIATKRASLEWVMHRSGPI